ncbi:hypothetical protein PMHK_30040 [Pseudomonas sp. MHK4]
MILEKWASESISRLLKQAAVSGEIMPARKAAFVTSKSALASNGGGIESGRAGFETFMALTLSVLEALVMQQV